MTITAHSAYIKAYEKARLARDNSKSYIAIQHGRRGSFRLVATNNPRRMDAHCCALPVPSWAENIVYCLACLGYIEGGSESVDAYFELERVIL